MAALQLNSQALEARRADRERESNKSLDSAKRDAERLRSDGLQQAIKAKAKNA